MLKEFSFRNCRSFKDESVLSMEANYALKDNIDFVVQRGGAGNAVNLNPVTAIYGSNAGGKTNMLRALSDALENIYVGLRLRNIPYMSDKNEFMHKLVIICGDSEYEYQYTVNNSEVLTENFWARDLSAKGGRKVVFVREGTSIKKSIYEKGDAKKDFLDMMASKKETLVMKMAGEVGLENFAPFYKWCGDVVIEMRDLGEKNRHDVLNKYATELYANEQRLPELEDFTNFMIRFDPSISTLSITADNPPPHAPPKDTDESDVKRSAHLILWHKKRKTGNKEADMPFLVENASNGTKKLMELYPSIKKALENGAPFVCDELDTLLHPLVFKQVVTMFNDKEYNPKGAQLIFTAHNTIVMNRECLRRDEIHFVDKDEYGESSVFRLSDVVDDDGNKIRMDALYDRLYLTGFLGATPEQFRNTAIQGGEADETNAKAL
jgi:AAA15 family ATPase/GTPase